VHFHLKPRIHTFLTSDPGARIAKFHFFLQKNTHFCHPIYEGMLRFDLVFRKFSDFHNDSCREIMYFYFSKKSVSKRKRVDKKSENH